MDIARCSWLVAMCCSTPSIPVTQLSQGPDLNELRFLVPLVETRLLQRAVFTWACSKMGSRCICSVHWNQELRSPSRYIFITRIKQSDPEGASSVWHGPIPILVQNADKIWKDVINGGFPHPKLLLCFFNSSCSQKLDLLLSNSNLGGHSSLEKTSLQKKGG